MKTLAITFSLTLALLFAVACDAEDEGVVAVIGTGDMGDSLGPRFAELGYRVVYGSCRIGRNIGNSFFAAAITMVVTAPMSTRQKDGSHLSTTTTWPNCRSLVKRQRPVLSSACSI
jgi:hypothetical protein